MAEKKGCFCGGGTTQEPGENQQGQGSCGGCSGLQLELYWCETCRIAVPDKRCHLCGQKARRSRPADGR